MTSLLPVPLARAGELAAGLRPVERLAASWLVEYRGHTRAAYVHDLAAWSGFCAEREVDLMGATRVIVAAYTDHLQNEGLGGGDVQSQALRADRLLPQGCVLGDHHAHTNSATFAVPFPSGLETVSVPPAAATRSLSEVRQKAGLAPPMPSSPTSTTTRPRSWSTVAEGRVAERRVSTRS